LACLGLALLTAVARAQVAPPPKPLARPQAIPAGEIEARSVTQWCEGPWCRLRGRAELETAEALLRADSIDYNEQTGEAEARGNVYLKRFAEGEEIWAERVDYNVRTETGRFYAVRGSVPARIEARPGVLHSSNPFYFQGEWAERLQDRYVLHDGFITNCKMPRPWWVLAGSKFDIIPGRRAVAYHTVLRMRKVPLLYAPVYYKPLERMPRRSGLLAPNIGNSSRRGKMLGGGYYWAINRSYDVSYRGQYFTQRGLAHNVDVRGAPREGIEFSGFLYGVNDRGLKLKSGERIKQGGVLAAVSARADLGWGFQARSQINYLSSLLFRQAFTESFNEAIFSEVHSIGFAGRHWSSYGLNFVFQRHENFQSTQPGDAIVIRKLPLVEFSSRPRQVWRRALPVWVSLDSSAGLMRRKQPLFQTRQFLERTDLRPHVMTAFRWKDISLIPSFSMRHTRYGSSWDGQRVVGRSLDRFTREFALALELPSLSRVYKGPSWLGQGLKHVIEPRASFRKVSGIGDFDRIIRFDETELVANTTEAEISLTNRLLGKRGGRVFELASWEVWQRRYFDPDFGAAVVAGRRNVLASSLDLTGYAFLDGPRRYSPVVSAFRLAPYPGFGVEWRADYDPLRQKMVNSGLTADARLSKYFVSVGHNSVRSTRTLSPPANQFRGLIGIGQDNRRGWNAAFSAIYDFRTGQMQFSTTQVTYNTDCCGWSVQYRRFSFGARNENQFRVAFVLANIGSFGTLKKQERLF